MKQKMLAMVEKEVLAKKIPKKIDWVKNESHWDFLVFWVSSVNDLCRGRMEAAY